MADTTMKRLMAVDFALYETILFLDTHPTNRKAKAYYDKLKTQRQALADQLKKEGKTLTAMDVDGDTWSWINTPWPWQTNEEA